MMEVLKTTEDCKRRRKIVYAAAKPHIKDD